MNSSLSGSSKTVMIVDDEVFFRKMLRDILDEDGFTIIAEAVDGVDAVSSFQNQKPDVVLMDIYMPGKNGIEAARDILAIDGSARIVICSGQGYDDDARAALDIGARYVILKPFIKDEVLDIVNRVLGE